MFFRLQKTILQMKDNRAAGEHEGAKAPLVIRLLPSKMSGTDFLTSVARFFVKTCFHKKCGVFSACKKVTDFFDTLKTSGAFAPDVLFL